MKHLELLLAGIAMGLFTTASVAQTKKEPGNPFLRRILPLSQQSAGQQAKSTTAGSRLIAETDLQDNAGFTPTDTTVYFYSGTRGGDLDHTLKFDSGISWHITAPNTYVNAYSAAQSFDNNNNIISQRSWEWNMATNSWNNSDSLLLEYDGNNNLRKTTQQQWDVATSSWQYTGRDTSVYDANNNVTAHTWQNWDNATSTWINSEEDLYTYMPNNKLATTFIKVWNGSLNQWDSIAYFVNIQDANGNIILTTTQSHDIANNLWVNSQRDSFVYDGMNRMLSNWKFNWNTLNSVWFATYRFTYSNFTGNVAQNELIEWWNDADQAFQNAELTLKTYNTYEQLTSYTNAQWDSIAWASPSYGGRYYYEPYTLTVVKVASTNGHADIYPIPAKNEITISVSWDEPQASTINISDMRGSIVNSWNVASAAAYNKAISISDLPPGNYIIKISGTKGQIAQQLSIAR